MKFFSSLFAKIIFWFFLNMTLVGLVLVAFFAFQSQLDLHTILGQHASDRMRIAGRLIAHEMSQTPRADWNDVLVRYGEIYQIDFSLVFEDGSQLSPKDFPVPRGVVQKALSIPHPRFALARFLHTLRPGNGFEIGGPGRDAHRPGIGRHHRMDWREANPQRYGWRGSKIRLMMRTTNPVRYWTGVWIPVFQQPKAHPVPAMLLAASESITGNGFFFDPVPWLVVSIVVILISVVVWIPFVRHITKPLTRMTKAAEEIAKGRFGVKIEEQRADEIGRLSAAINHMTSRLSGLVSGQKRFLSDVAHELGSPIARIQLGLGILEQRVDRENRERVADVMEDVSRMSNLVNELLSFSRAEINPAKVRLEATQLLPIVERVVQGEQMPGVEIISRIAPALMVMADPELLARALANIVRNALRYAGDAGPINISGRMDKGRVLIEVRDSGPGVPEDMVNQLFEPFFRPEPSRDRESGGVGLGLAIVKTCVQACNGTVIAQNAQPTGFMVTIALDAPAAYPSPSIQE